MRNGDLRLGEDRLVEDLEAEGYRLEDGPDDVGLGRVGTHADHGGRRTVVVYRSLERRKEGGSVLFMDTLNTF